MKRVFSYLWRLGLIQWCTAPLAIVAGLKGRSHLVRHDQRRQFALGRGGGRNSDA